MKIIHKNNSTIDELPAGAIIQGHQEGICLVAGLDREGTLKTLINLQDGQERTQRETYYKTFPNAVLVLEPSPEFRP